MIARAAAAGLMLAAMGCTTVPPEQPEEEIRPIGDGRCDAAAVRNLVGHPASEGLGTEARTRSGAGRIRWIRPDDAVTMDYRTDRLNIRLDRRGRVASFDCG